MANDRQNYYQALEQGRFVIIEGNLGQDPEIKEGDNYTIATISIANKAGSRKDEQGNYKDITDWYKLSIFDNGANSSALIEFLRNPSSEKMAFKKGQRVKFIGYIKKGKSVANGDNIYVNEDVVEFLSLKRILTGGGGNNNSDNSEATQSDKPKANSETDNIPF